MVEMDRVDDLVNSSAGQAPALGAKWRLGGVPMGLNSVVIYCYFSFVVGVLRCDWR